jgi:hypothetical protein
MHITNREHLNEFSQGLTLESFTKNCRSIYVKSGKNKKHLGLLEGTFLGAGGWMIAQNPQPEVP